MISQIIELWRTIINLLSVFDSHHQPIKPDLLYKMYDQYYYCLRNDSIFRYVMHVQIIDWSENLDVVVC